MPQCFSWFFEELREVTGVKALLAGEDDWNDLVLAKVICFLGKVSVNSVFLGDANKRFQDGHLQISLQHYT